MPGFKGNQDRLITEGYPKRWLWQGSPYIAAVTPLPSGQPLIVIAQSLLRNAGSSNSTIIQAGSILALEPPGNPLIVIPQRRLTSTPSVTFIRAVSASAIPTPTRQLVVSIRPPGKRPTTPSLLSAGVGIVPEPSELLRSPLIIQPEPPPPTSAPTFHAGVMQEAIIPPQQRLIVPPPIKLISSPTILSGYSGIEIIIPRGQLIVPAQELPKTRPAIFRQFPSKSTAEPSTFWIPRGWVPDGWVPLPEAEEASVAGTGQQLIIAARPQPKQTPTALLRSFTPTVPLVWPSRPLIVPPQVALVPPQPNTLKWRIPPLVLQPPAQPLIVLPQARAEQKPSILHSVIQPSVVLPPAALIVPGQPSPSIRPSTLDWFTPEAIIPPAGTFVIVIPELPPDQTRPRLALSRTTRFPTPIIPPINAQLIVRAHLRILYQQPFAILGGESLIIPSPIAATLDLGLLATYSDGEFVFSRKSDSTL